MTPYSLWYFNTSVYLPVDGKRATSELLSFDSMRFPESEKYSNESLPALYIVVRSAPLPYTITPEIILKCLLIK